MTACSICRHDVEMHVVRDPEGIPDPEPCRVRIIDPDAPEGWRRCLCIAVGVAGFVPLNEEVA